MRVTNMALAASMTLSCAVVVAAAGVVGAPAASAAVTTAPCATTTSHGYLAPEVVVSGIGNPQALDVDSNGNVFVAERGTYSLLKLTEGQSGYTLQTLFLGYFNGNLGVAVDPTGKVWTTEASNNLLDVVVPDGHGGYLTPQTAASGIYGPSRVGVDAVGNVYVTAAQESANGLKIVKVTPDGSFDAPKTVVRSTVAEGVPQGVDVDAAGAVYSTYSSGKVVKSTPSGGGYTDSVIPATGLASPNGLDIDDDGTIFIADTGNDRIVALRPSGAGYLQTTVMEQTLDGPVDVEVGPGGSLFVADTGNDRVLRAQAISVDAVDDTATTSAGQAVTTATRANDSATDTALADPAIASVPAHGTVTVGAGGAITYTPNPGFSGSDSYRYALRDSTGTVCDTATVRVTVGNDDACGNLPSVGQAWVGRAVAALDGPEGLVSAPGGVVFAADGGAGKIHRYTPVGDGSTDYVDDVVASGLQVPTGLTRDDDGHLYVTERFASRVLELTPAGDGYTSAVIASGGLMHWPTGVAVDSHGNVLVASDGQTIGNGTLVMLRKADGYAQELMTGGLDFAKQVVVDEHDVAYVTSWTAVKRVRTTTGGYLVDDVATGLGDAQGLALDPSGAIYIGDWLRRRITVATPDGPGYHTEDLAGWDEHAGSLARTDDGALFTATLGGGGLLRISPVSVRAIDDAVTTDGGVSVTIDVRANDDTNVLLSKPDVVQSAAHGTVIVRQDGSVTYVPGAGFSGTDTFTYKVTDDADPATICGFASVTVDVGAESACGALPARYDFFSSLVANGFTDPRGIALDTGDNGYLADAGMVLKLPGGSGPSPIQIADEPEGVATDDADNVYYTDQDDGLVAKLVPSGGSYTKQTVSHGVLVEPTGIAVGHDGNIYVGDDFETGLLVRFTPSGGGYDMTVVATGVRPRGVAVDDDGNVFVADRSRDAILEFQPSGDGYQRRVIASNLDSPTGLGLESEGVLVVGDSGHRRLLRLTPNGSGYRQTTIEVWGDHEPGYLAISNLGQGLAVIDQENADARIVVGVGLVASNDVASTAYNAAVTTTVLANDEFQPLVPLAMSVPIVSTEPQHGTAVVNANGTITYTPDEGFSGDDTYVYRVTDDVAEGASANLCDTAKVSVHVANGFLPGNGVTVPQNGSVEIPLDDMVTAVGAPVDPTSVGVSTEPEHGGVTVDPGTGSARYVPAGGYSGPDEFKIDVCDTATPAECSSVAVPITVEPNTVTIKDDLASVVTGGDVTIDVVANDISASGQEFGDPHVIDDPDHGSVTLGAGDLTYSSQEGFSGKDTFTYRLCDTGEPEACGEATVTVTVHNVFVPGPGVSVPQNHAVDVALDDVVTTKGAAVDPTSVEVTTGPEHGVVTVDPTTGALRFVPEGGYSGPDQIKLEVCDTAMPKECSTVVLPVTVESNRVDAVDDAAAVLAGMDVVVRVLANDLSASGQSLTDPVVIGQPTHGSVSATPGGLRYLPAPGFSGRDIFTYRVCDTGHPQVCDDATVTVLVGNVFVPGAGLSVPQNGSVDGALDALVSPRGAALDPTTVELASEPGHGVVTIDPASGTVTYEPDGGFSGSDEFTVRVCDTAVPQECTTVTVPVTVEPNTVTAVDDAASATTAVEIAIAVLDNDVSASGQPLGTPQVTTEPAHGTVSWADGAMHYESEAGFTGTDTFTYSVCDTGEPQACDDATVKVSVDREVVTPIRRNHPHVSLHAAHRMTLKVNRAGQVRPGRTVVRVRVRGFATGDPARALARAGLGHGTATLYGPFARTGRIRCVPATVQGRVGFVVRNGSFKVKGPKVRRPGYYAWVVSTRANAENRAAATKCGARTGTTLAHRAAYGRHLLVETGLGGVLPVGQRGIRALLERPVATRAVVHPVRVQVPGARLRARLLSVPARHGRMVIPENVDRGGWLTSSALPGDLVGRTVLAGHVSDEHDRPGEFGRLRAARVGMKVRVRMSDGRVRTYRITNIVTRPRGKGVRGAELSTTSSAGLTLVTCTDRVTYANGHFHYRKNLIITARPV